MYPIRYAVFAVVATSLNLIAQRVSFFMYAGKGALYIGLLVGTLVGLVSKYLLDKYFIFHSTTELSDSAQEFFLYCLVGGLTTLLFWGTELGFHFLFDSSYAKYIGGAIGLILGYYIKYQIDNRYVFNQGRRPE